MKQEKYMIKRMLPHKIDIDSRIYHEENMLKEALYNFIKQCDLKYENKEIINKNLKEIIESSPVAFTIEMYKKNNIYDDNEFEMGVIINPIRIQTKEILNITRKEQISNPIYNQKLTWKERITALLKGNLIGGIVEIRDVKED